jgi:small subunit ribosomal protein S2e
VKDGKIKSMEEIYLFSLPVKEYQIVDFFLPKLKDEVMKIMPVQKQTRAGQRTRFKAFVAIGDSDGHVGLGVKCAKEVATAIRGAIILGKLSCIPVRRGYWGAKLGDPHTVPSKVSGKVGSVMCRLIPAPRGTGIVAAPACKRILQLAGVEDCYTQSKGSTATMGNFLKATFVAVSLSLPFLSHSGYLLNSDRRSQKPTPSSPRTSGARSRRRRSHTTSSRLTFSSLRARRRTRCLASLLYIDCFAVHACFLCTFSLSSAEPSAHA